ncbi:MAG: hypothetical protein LH473_07945 [Chitinophagales bacterium]|nr:hypothetical protein [Chitinophagales bacterium]
MKQKIFLAQTMVTFIILCTTVILSNAQTVFEKYQVGADYFGRLNDPNGNAAKGVLIGNSTSAPVAALEINTMLINGGSTPYTAGNVFTTKCATTENSSWYMYKGTSSLKFHIKSPASSDDIFLGTVAAGDLNFETTFVARMTIIGNNNIPNWGNNVGYVGIGNNEPLSMLHIGTDLCYNGLMCTGNTDVPRAGWRPWMTTGTFYCEETDHMYTGLKRTNYDRQDAVVAWGDNIGTTSSLSDNLIFIFTEYCEDDDLDETASGTNGLEAM